MNYVDTAILDVVEELCRRFQRITGRTNVWLAGQLTNLSIVIYFVWAWIYPWGTDLWVRISVALFCISVLYALTQTVFKVSIETSESAAYQRVAKGLRNPRRVRDAVLRISFLTLSVIMWSPLLVVDLLRRTGGVRLSYLLVVLTRVSYLLVVLMTVVLYLLACDPLPPCTGKVREWLRGLVPARIAPAPESQQSTVDSRQ
jgi:hypothetical protein